jgi:hypothetical protein
MKRRLRYFAIAVLLVPAGAQLIQPDTRTPRVDPARSLWSGHRVSPQVADITRRACGNCHSYETKWPWYAKVSPVSWFLARHVNKGREKLNFNEWSSAAAVHQLEEIYDSVNKKKMPLGSYLLMHPEALSPADRDVLLVWAGGKSEPGSR